MAGHPTLYREEYNEQAYKLCLLGHTDIELAAFFEVAEDTIYEWKKVHPQFSESVKRGKDKADAEVAQAFLKRALGYQYEEETFEMGVNTKTVTKEVPPDAGAALNWLKNRQPKKWRDKQEVESTTVNYNVDITAEEAKTIANALNDKF